MPIAMVAAVAQMNWMMGNSVETDKLYQSANQLMTEAFSSIRVVHAYNLQSYIYSNYAVTLVGRSCYYLNLWPCQPNRSSLMVMD